MSEKTLNGKTILKRVLPVGLALVLVVLIAVIATTAKRCNSKVPGIVDPDGVYMKLGDLVITNDQMYTYLRKEYGTAELIRLIDEEIYKSEMDDVDQNELDKYIIKSLFSVEDVKKYIGDPQEEWDQIINSLLINNLLTKAQANESDFYDTDSEVWKVVRSYYKLQYVREQWAKKEFVKRYKDEKEKEGEDLFTEDQIESYYKSNYTGTVVGFYIPFTSEKSAFEMMKKYGINTQTSVLSKNGWVTSEYDYNTQYTLEDKDYLTNTEVLDIFFKMYNEVYSYYNNGQDIITSDIINEYTDYAKTLFKAKTKLSDLITSKKSTIEGSFVLPTAITITDVDDVAITWELGQSDVFKLEDDGKTVTVAFPEGSTASSASVSIAFTATYEDNLISYSDTITVTKKNEMNDGDIWVVEPVDPYVTYKLAEDFLENPGNDYSKFIWTDAEMTAINASLATQLSYDSTKLKLDANPANFYASYTIKPVAVGDYYFLIIKLDAEAAPSLEDVTDEIIEKLLEELVTENEISRLIYENRTEHNLKIFDHYIEAIYDYQYTNFFESTLQLTNYTKWKNSKKKTTTVAASYEIDGVKKEITVEEVFKSLLEKYGVSISINLVNQYKLISDKNFNNIYNPYTNEIYDKKILKDLLNGEVGSFRKNFELDYFTYSYLSYYGFTPNFPASYGWKNFTKDYFGAYTDEQLLSSSLFGGSIYTDALDLFQKTLYNTEDYQRIMSENYEKWYSTSVINLIVYIDYNYDSTIDNNTVGQIDSDKDKDNIEISNWTDEQRALAVELANLIFDKAIETGETTLAAQLNKMVTLYKEASNEVPTESYNGQSVLDYNLFAKYKNAGLLIKFEGAATYDNSSSIVEEFSDELKKIYDEISELGLTGTTLDAPFIGGDAFETVYGYHKIAVLATTEPTRLPTEEEIEIYELLEEIAAYKDSTYEHVKVKYQAALARIKEILGDEYKADLTGDDYEEYTQDAEAVAAIEAWYTNAITELTDGDLASENLMDYLEENYNNIIYTNVENLDLLKLIVKISREDLEKEDSRA